MIHAISLSRCNRTSNRKDQITRMNYDGSNSILNILSYRLHESSLYYALENFKQIVTINRRCQIAAINLSSVNRLTITLLAAKLTADLLFKP